MQIFNADLHIHSPKSIAVSQSLNLDTMLETCKKKGLNILGTGDILQPEWARYMEENLQKDKDGAFHYKDVYFILQTEIEDEESIHQVVFLPNFDAVKRLQKKLDPHSPNMMNEWGGRPRVNLPPAEIVDIVVDEGGLIGPAHAFTPFKAIFRQNKFETLEDCYQDAAKNIHFLELGLSGNTYLADRMDCLKNISFLSNSDAHSQSERSLGREFNKMEMDNASFEELELALTRKNGRSITLNMGLHPKLGKYYNMFCRKCRRRVLFKKSKKSGAAFFNQYSSTENFIMYFSSEPEKSRLDYIQQVAKNKMTCPACKEETGKNHKIKLGVSERIEMISQHEAPKHPDHRPTYINAIPLYDIIRSVKGIKSTSSKTVSRLYDKLIEVETEFHLLLDTPLSEIKKVNEDVATVIEAFRNDEIEYTPGGGGTYGQIKLDLDA